MGRCRGHPPRVLYWILRIPATSPGGVSETNVHVQPRCFTRWRAMWPNWAGKFWWTNRTCISALGCRLAHEKGTSVRGRLSMSVWARYVPCFRLFQSTTSLQAYALSRPSTTVVRVDQSTSTDGPFPGTHLQSLELPAFLALEGEPHPVNRSPAAPGLDPRGAPEPYSGVSPHGQG